METFDLLYVALALATALAGSKLAKVSRLPNVTGYLVLGILVGPYCFNFLHQEYLDKFSIVTDVALVFIAFTIGAEFEWKFLKRVGKAPVIIGIMEGLTATLLVDIILLSIGTEVPMALCIGAIASATAAASTMMVVKQYKCRGPLTNTLLPVVAIDDAVALICYGISLAIAKLVSGGVGENMALSIAKPFIEIVVSLLFGGLLGFILSLLCKLFTGRGNRLACTLTMLFICLSLCDKWGLSTLLACMMLGAIFANTSAVSDKIFEPVDRLTPPIYMVFFILSGASLNIRIIPTLGVIGVIYVVFRVVGKSLGAYLGATVCKCEPTVKKWMGLTLIPQEGVAIGLATLAQSAFPEYGQTIKTVVLCGIIIYELIGPMVTKFALKKAGELTVDPSIVKKA